MSEILEMREVMTLGNEAVNLTVLFSLWNGHVSLKWPQKFISSKQVG